MRQDMSNNDFDIKEINSIIAIEILADTYKIDVIKYNKKEIKYIMSLLNHATKSSKIEE